MQVVGGSSLSLNPLHHPVLPQFLKFLWSHLRNFNYSQLFSGGGGLVAKSCPLFHNSMDCGSPGSSVHGISQARLLEWVATSGDLSNQGIEPTSPAWQADSLTLSHQQSPQFWVTPSSVQFSHSVVSDSLWPPWTAAPQASLSSPIPGVYLNSCPLSQWCHPAISSSVIPFSSCPQSFPASGSFPMSQYFASGGQSIGTSALASVLPMNIQDSFPLGLTDLISLQSKGLSRVFSNSTIQNHNSSTLSFLYTPTLTSIHDSQ